MKKSVIASILLYSFVLAGCRDQSLPVDPPVNPPPPTLQLTLEEEQVVANCYTVQEAVEAFAADNNGVYPHNTTTDTNLSSNTVVDLLPGGMHLLNPFTGFRQEPRDGAAATPGETGYLKTVDGNLVPVNYVIAGFGETETILILTKDGPVR